PSRSSAPRNAGLRRTGFQRYEWSPVPPPKVPAGLRYGFTPPVPLADLLNRRLPGQVGVEVHPGAVLNGFLSESAVGVGHATISGLSVCSDTRRPRRRASVSAVLPGRTWIESREPALRYG